MAAPKNSGAIGVGLLGLAAVLIYNKLFPGPPDPRNGPAGIVDPAKDDARPATFTTAQAAGLANAFYAAIYAGFFNEDEEVMRHILLQCQVTNDVKLLINAYGTRSTVATMALDLPGAVAAYMPVDMILGVNLKYAQRAINYRF